MSKKLYIGNLAYATTEQSLKDTFSQAGNVVSASVITHRDTGRSKGFGFVEMSSEEEAKRAMELFNGKDLDNRKIRVDLAQERSSTGGNGGDFRRNDRPSFSRNY
ncbi:MAG: RNA-binding protein [Candidatus Margulisiibacteriota bacterium]